MWAAHHFYQFACPPDPLCAPTPTCLPAPHPACLPAPHPARPIACPPACVPCACGHTAHSGTGDRDRATCAPAVVVEHGGLGVKPPHVAARVGRGLQLAVPVPVPPICRHRQPPDLRRLPRHPPPTIHPGCCSASTDGTAAAGLGADHVRGEVAPDLGVSARAGGAGGEGGALHRIRIASDQNPRSMDANQGPRACSGMEGTRHTWPFPCP